MISPESVLVPYNGKTLISRSLCYWKVRVWNEDDLLSDWSDPASFSTGLLNESDWVADYIGFPDKEGRSPAPQFRKTFELPAKPEKVFLHVNSLGYHEVYLNMIDNGATATWEHWDGSRSRIHNCYNGIGSWFYEAVGGMRADENFPAWKRLLIDPQIPAGITWANTTKETPYGTVTVNWNLEKDILEISVKIPVGCTAAVKIPENAKSLKLNGRTVKTDGSFTEIESGEHFLRFRL